MKRHLFFFISMVFFINCRSVGSGTEDSHIHGIIPAPITFKSEASGKLSSLKNIQIYLQSGMDQGFYTQLTDGIPEVRIVKDQATANVQIESDSTLSSESYVLRILDNQIQISASSTSGIQYAVVSLCQMVRFRGLPLPVCTIEDKPAFSYRGMHLDVARHFFSIDDVKKYLDYMAFYKYNHFHWHLTEDQGWRIEIKKYPKLQEIAAWRKETLIGHYSDQPHQFDGKRYGGYYTQEEVREIVKYAAARNINVIPEIEMPGHSLAALSAYPELGCSGGPYEVATKWGIFEEVFCPTEATFQFLEDVIDEVVSLFPGKYIHIGGDECPKESWKKSAFCQKLIKEKGLKDEHELQSYFITRMEKYINSKGKQIIGWDEILEGGLAPNATVMSWRGVSGGIEAANAGHDVIMTPGSHCYFDHYQSEALGEPLAIGGYTPLQKVYHWNPVPLKLSADKHKFIIGGQANVWTEYIPAFEKVEYMAFARGMAMAEALWGSSKDYPDFLMRFNLHHNYWSARGANVAFHILDLTPNIKAGDGKPVRVKFDAPEGSSIEYVVNGQDQKTALPEDEVIIDRSVHYSFRAKKGENYGRKLDMNFTLHKATSSVINIDPAPSSKYPGNGPGSIVNGITGSNDKYGGLEWLGFEGTDAVVTLDFKSVQPLYQVLLRFFKSEGQWIYLPPKIEIWVSDDNTNYRKYTSIENIGAYEKIGDVLLDLGGTNTRYLRVHAYNYGVIPSGRQGAGHRAWLFMDEVVVN